MSLNELNNLALQNFTKYLKIPTVHPNPDFDECIDFFKYLTEDIGLTMKVYEFVRNKPVVVISWEGVEPQLKSILLNGHMDVVPVSRDNWTRDPFGAEMDENGNIYARGSQDMKCTTMQHLEAIRRLKLKGIKLRRTIYVSLMPDEEVGGEEGMKVFVKTKAFEDMNVGFALDEGGWLDMDEYPVLVGEKSIWTMVFRCRGTAGHGSLLLPNTPGEKVAILLNKLNEYRNKQCDIVKENTFLKSGEVVSLNLTIIEGGVQNNVIPDEFVLTVDSRVPSTIDLVEWENTLVSWCKEAGDGVTLEFIQKEYPVPIMKLDDSNPFWLAFKKASEKSKIKLVPVISNGATDVRYVRALGIPALGFSTMNNTTPMRIHDHDEYLNKDVFLQGISIFEKIISEIANVNS